MFCQSNVYSTIVCFFSRMSCFGAQGSSEQTPEELEALRQQKLNSKNIDSQLKREGKEYKSTHRLLLLGQQCGV